MLFFVLATIYVVVLPFKRRVCKNKLRSLCYYTMIGAFCCAVYQHWDFIAGVLYALDVYEYLCVVAIVLIVNFSGVMTLLKDNNPVKIVLLFFISAKRRWEGESWDENFGERAMQMYCLLSLQTSKSFLEKFLQGIVSKDDAK